MQHRQGCVVRFCRPKNKKEDEMPQDKLMQARKLLIVDDSKVSRMLIRSFFAREYPLWLLQEAGSGDEALVLAVTFKPDFVTMDVNMPGINGFEAARQLALVNPTVCIVMLSANIQESSRTQASSLALDFVAKPVTGASLMQVLNLFLAA